MAKDQMIEALGERQLLLPALVGRALAANDRVKYLLALLQAAAATADGAVGQGNLREERLASGVDQPQLDRVVDGSLRDGPASYRIPEAELIVGAALDAVRTMLVPLEVAELSAAGELRQRLATISGALAASGDLVATAQLKLLTAGRRGGPDEQDSLHLVVMDAHRELNQLQARIATEIIDGARVHDLGSGDGTLVRAFMRGIHATERLRFDHPGLGTTATRIGPALVIQNDLGETDAHVVVIRVTGPVVTINYTDVHLVRLLFFQDLLAPWDVVWEDTRSRADRAIEGGLYHLASGRFESPGEGETERFLEHLGSRLVFIIDWNRARKRLRRVVRRRVAVDLLRWAAEHEYGHIAFLRAGADGLIYDALEFAGGRVMPAGQTLEDALGPPAAVDYLRAVLRICSEGLLAGRPVSVVQDEVRAELTRYLRSAREEILELALQHAGLCVEIAEAARDELERTIVGAGERHGEAAGRARLAEHEADALVTKARDAVARSADLKPFLDLIEAADDIADSAEEAAFYATLMALGHPSGEVRTQVRRIAQLVLAASREYLRAVQLSAELRRGVPREEIDAFLSAAHEAIKLEHETDAAQRAVHQALVASTDESGASLFVIVEVTRAYEETADALMHSAHLLRDHAMARMVGSEPSLQRPREEAPVPRHEPLPEGADEYLYALGDSTLPIPDVDSIGAKAHGLARVAGAGLRVPEAVVLRTKFARARDAGTAPPLPELLAGAISTLEGRTGVRLGSTRRPLLLSVRSGAPASMPGMLETVLNVGMCDSAVRGLIALTGNPRLAWDSYRRLVESYAAVVRGCPREPFERALRELLDDAGARTARELTAAALQQLVTRDLELFAELSGAPFPQDPTEQLLSAAEAVLASWSAPKAREYRRINGIPDGLGTAVILQRMVFGNAGGVSGAGVGFTRDPALGEPRLYVDFLVDAQGEDVVGGRQTVEGISELAGIAPEVVGQVEELCQRLESEFGDAQEFEITVQEGELFLLQTRTAKRTPWAALRIATDQVHEGLISPALALERLDGLDLEDLRRLHVTGSDPSQMLCHAIPASIGVATGPVALDPEAARRIAGAGTPPVLVRAEAITEDVAAVAVSAGVLTRAGGRTSHAAVIARELGKPCLVGCEGLELDLETRMARIGDRLIPEGEVICLDAESGLVLDGAPVITEERPTERLREVAGWRAAQRA
jgi:pyruvate, orthophosphate dikinase